MSTFQMRLCLGIISMLCTSMPFQYYSHFIPNIWKRWSTMDKKLFRILAIAGSLRQGSYNLGLLRAAHEVAPEWVEVQFFDIGTLPFFNEDVEAAGDPEPVRQFKDAIRASNALLIATHEYNRSVPGILANAIDWASRPTGRSALRNKPVAVMGAVLGKSGSANAQAILRGVLGRIGAVVVPDPRYWCHRPPNCLTSR
jgi:chromate reductase